MKKLTVLNVVLGILLTAFASVSFAGEWQEQLEAKLPEYGHRNWIVIADSAYPKQSADGIETIYTGEDHLAVLEHVLKAVEDAPHVYAKVLVDSELDSVSEADAPGVTAYRERLKELVKGQQTQVMPHEDIISQLDEGSELFNVLLLKTTLTIPYTSVFLELDCGYWSAEKEQRLRDAIANGK